jgi:methionyl aminopeptidase
MPKGHIKTAEEIEIIAQGGQILRKILLATANLVKPGISTWELNRFAENAITQAGGKPSFKNYGEPKNPFPAGLCTSINDVIVHGIPSKQAILNPGDIIGLDIGMQYQGLYTDTAITVPVGQISNLADRLLKTTQECLKLAIQTATVGHTIGDIGYAIQTHAEANGFSVVRDLVGHGVGYEVHEAPEVPCFGKLGQGLKLEAGMVLAIEPMLCEKSWKIAIEDDGWTITTFDHRLSAHFEHTIAITKNGVKILT